MKILDVPRSGSYAGVTSSRNRNGQYVRTRAIPVNPGTTFQGAVRNRLTGSAQGWRALTALQRAGWADLGNSMVRVDSLGQAQTLTGFQAYVSVNNNNIAAGNAAVSAAPALGSPTALLTITPTLTNATFSLAYTTTPLPAGARCFTYASPQRSAGRSFEKDLRLIQVSAAAAASPVDLFTAYTARFGTPVVGNRVFYAIRCYLAGFLSGEAAGSAVVA